MKGGFDLGGYVRGGYVRSPLTFVVQILFPNCCTVHWKTVILTKLLFLQTNIQPTPSSNDDDYGSDWDGTTHGGGQ